MGADAVEKLDEFSCAALLQQRLYDPAILPSLEAYVDSQCAEQLYDLECNLAVLKLYQFHPEKSKAGVVAKILAKALMNLPGTDYLLCTYLLPERSWEESELAAVAAVAAQLEVCAFRSVWKLLEPLSSLLHQIPGFESALREFVLDTMQITYQVICFPPTHPFLPYVAPHLSHISHFQSCFVPGDP